MAIPYKVMVVRTTVHVELLPSVYLRDGAQCLWKHSDVSILFLFDFQNFTDRSLGHANILSYSWSTHVTWSMVAKNRGVFLTVSFPKKIKASLPIGFWYFIKSTIEVNRRNTITFSIWILKLARNDKGFQYYENLPKIFLTHIFRKIKFCWIILLFFLNRKKNWIRQTELLNQSIYSPHCYWSFYNARMALDSPLTRDAFGNEYKLSGKRESGIIRWNRPSLSVRAITAC